MAATFFGTVHDVNQLLQLLLEKLERRASLDSLSALMALVIEEDHLGKRAFAMKATSSLHRVLLMLAMERYGIYVAVGLIDWLCYERATSGSAWSLVGMWRLALTTFTRQPI